ncbi:helix-turn-helix domain-containing protein [Pseudomonas sp. SJZ079]|uniref:helix-turn-helix domain-containing protein n=1 Tax=Pseudomonas sp. SJZ079 TaxID=2572887 RepID=UPI00273D8E83|nr:helix-turn-helix domain-containing protein [Pseudomonas sp. SJZ079]
MFIRNRPLDSLKKPPAKMVVAMNVKDVPHDPARRWEWIKYQLRVRGSSAANLARQLGITDRAIRATKERSYPRVERAIAAALGTTPEMLWPERWNNDGTPMRQRPNRAEHSMQYHCTGSAKDSRYCPVPHRISGKEA